jgi:imidazolonepropionase-like amidohydrolase
MAVGLIARTAAAQRPTLAGAVRPFVAVDTNAVAPTHVRVIDGTGAAPKIDQTIVIRDRRIASIGNSAATQVPAGTLIMDLTGKSVIPGLVMVHERLHYPTGPGVYANLTESFSRLYLAGGVTSMRTAGNVNGIVEIQLKKAIDAGAHVGPWMDATAPYLEAIKVGTLNGAMFLGRGALVGSIVTGKQADLVVIDGDPSTRIDDVRKVTLVFKHGVGYEPEKLIASVRGRVGLF